MTNFQTDRLNMAFARIQAITWEECGMDEKRDPLLTELMTEFLALMRQWNVQVDRRLGRAFSNLALLLNPDLTIPNHMEEWLEELKEADRINMWGKYYVVAGLRAYLYWEQRQTICVVSEKRTPQPL